MFLALTCIITIFLAIAWLFLFKRYKILDKPGNDLKNTRKPVPTMQGLVIYAIFLVLIAVFHRDYFLMPIFQGFLAGGTIIVMVETLTELEYLGRIKLKIPPMFRFFIHILAGCLALWISWISDYEFILNNHIFVLPNWLLYLLFAGRSACITSAVNRIDGINAQWNWVLAIGFGTIFALIQFVVFPAYTDFNNLEILVFTQQISLILAIISLVYTVIEFKPLGLVRDIGTMFLAFGLAYLSVIWGAKIGTMIVTLSLVVFDAIWIFFYRLAIVHKNPMKWDYTHIHHRLMGLGRTKNEIRVFVWWFSIFMMIIILLQWTNRLHKIIIFWLIALIFFGVNSYLFLYKKLHCWLPQKKEE